MQTFIQPWNTEDQFKPRFSKEWLDLVISCMQRTGWKSLTHGKDLRKIEEYSTGNIDMKPFMNNYRSLRKKLVKNFEKRFDMKPGDFNDLEYQKTIFRPLPLIPIKLNSAVHLVFQRKFDNQVIATDSVASKKRQKDIDFLENAAKIQAIRQELNDQLGLGEVKPETTKNSSVPYTKAPLDLDITDPIEKQIFSDVIYKLQPEAALEVISDAIYQHQDLGTVDLMEIQDHFKYGCSAHDVEVSKITEMPNLKYLSPEKVFVPDSEYPDFRDNDFRMYEVIVTPHQLMNAFADEITSESQLEEIMNGYAISGGRNKHYTGANKLAAIPKGDFSKYGIKLWRVQFICMDSIDYVENKAGLAAFCPPGTKGAKKMWGQNTYDFYWLANTDYYFGKTKLGWAYRQAGREAFTTFSIKPYRSQIKSPVELCIGENEIAQDAYIKMAHAIQRSSSDGKMIDMAFFRGVIDGLVDDGRNEAEVMQELMDAAIEDNNVVIDTQGMDGKNQGQFVPYREIKGGLGNIEGYVRVILQASQNIGRWTGWNDDMAGLNNNPDVLNFARKSNIAYGMNAINYAYEARERQFQQVFYIFAWCAKKMVEDGGEAKQYIQDIVGKDRTDAINKIDCIKDHTFFMNIKLGMREEEKQSLEGNILMLKQKGQITAFEELIIKEKKNIKEASILLACVEKKEQKRQDAIRQEGYAAQQQNIQATQQGQAAMLDQQNQGKISQIQASGETEAMLMRLSSDLGLNQQQTEAYLKRIIQADRLQQNDRRNSEQIQAKLAMHNNQMVQPLV